MRVQAPAGREAHCCPRVMLDDGERHGEAQQDLEAGRLRVQVLAVLWLVCACVESLKFSDCSYFICKMEIIFNNTSLIHGQEGLPWLYALDSLIWFSSRGRGHEARGITHSNSIPPPVLCGGPGPGEFPFPDGLLGAYSGLFPGLRVDSRDFWAFPA